MNNDDSGIFRWNSLGTQQFADCQQILRLTGDWILQALVEVS